jgi:hypothetical protein
MGTTLPRWTPNFTSMPGPRRHFSLYHPRLELQPEALIVYSADPNEIEILSDDGTRELLGVACKNLLADQQAFGSGRSSSPRHVDDNRPLGVHHERSLGLADGLSVRYEATYRHGIGGRQRPAL